MDIMKLMMSDYQVQECSEADSLYEVLFHGPKGTLYENGVWKVRVTLPAEYPYKSPSIGFATTLFHPNVDRKSGSVCLDVINQRWSPMYDLVNIFDVFLPQLLAYPNPHDPLNSEAASLLLDEPEKYKDKVKFYVKEYASSGQSAERMDVDVPGKLAGQGQDVCQNSNSSCSTDISESDDDLRSISDDENDDEEDGFDVDI